MSPETDLQKGTGKLTTRFFANFVGAGWSAMLQLGFVPTYVRAMGVEAYGLVGLYVALLAILQVVDLGLGPTINREMAYAGAVENRVHQRNALRTLELIYVPGGVVLGLAVWLMAGTIADYWLRPESLGVGAARHAIELMGFLVLFQWPQSLYQNALIGMQRQVLANVLKAGFATLGAAGGVVVLYTISPTIMAFLTWQVAVAAVQLLSTAVITWRLLATTKHKPAFNKRWLRAVSGFALGVTGITAAGIALTQLDKVLLSHLLNLREFGIYTLAGVFGVGLAIISNAIFLVTFPAYTAHIARHDEQNLLRLYRFAAQTGAALNIATAAVAAGLSLEILTIWTGDSGVAQAAAPMMSLLAIGTGLNGLWKNAYSLQLAYGWTRLALRISWLMVASAVPLLIVMTQEFGGVGAAAVWLCLNAGLVGVGIPLTHRVLLPGGPSTWFVDLAKPALAAAIAMLMFRMFFPVNEQPPRILAAVLVAASLTLACSIAVAPHPRDWVLKRVRTWTRDIRDGYA